MEKLKSISINELKGIQKTTIEKLNQMGISTIYDLVMYFPYRYENYDVANLTLANHNDKVTVIGTVITEPVFSFFNRNKSRLAVTINVDQHVVKVIAFNRIYLRNKLQKGMEITVTGKFDKPRMQIVANQILLRETDEHRVEPVYSLKEMTKTTFLKTIRKALDQFGHYLNDDLPLNIQKRYRLVDLRSCLEFAHFPINNEQVRQVERRIKYEELLKFELKMHYLKYRRRQNTSVAGKKILREALYDFIKKLPYELTGDQKRAVAAILNDLEQPYQMNRLLQGDVGSGKTVVAGIGLYANYLAGYQGAIMAPTEILADQHYKTFSALFKGLDFKLALLTSSTPQKEKQRIYEALQLGEIDCIIGTHALITDYVQFKNLGMLVVDEQHRFGVNQRRQLKEKGLMPDALFLSATPIPRTLSLTVFGDMDVSIIKERPKGRLPVKTYLIQSKLEQRLIQFVNQTVQAGEQVYVVVPLIEESEKIDLKNAIDVYEKYQAEFNNFKVGLLHGRLSNEEKDAVMTAFKQNEIQILVATTVVEVGVDVPNATLMIIIDAERFGLSQLHQLRGRVGRGTKQSYCILVSDHDGDKTRERLEVLVQTNDGFEIAEADLRLRGPGDFFGSRQSGLPEFKMADIIEDYKILEVARQDAMMLIESNELFTNPEYYSLRHFIEQEILENQEIYD